MLVMQKVYKRKLSSKKVKWQQVSLAFDLQPLEVHHDHVIISGRVSLIFRLRH